ncbi:MAG: hypothetical protein JSU08_08860 [Acidobacteria bacterium]|nr:hypothetical protein [Acidobacteriota bacterium]
MGLVLLLSVSAALSAQPTAARFGANLASTPQMSVRWAEGTRVVPAPPVADPLPGVSAFPPTVDSRAAHVTTFDGYARQ